MNPYRIINFIFAGVILLMFVYSGFFVDENIVIQCVYQKALGRECLSCGITRDFHNFLTLDFDAVLNEYSALIFLFFLIQFIWRLTVGIFDGRLKTERFRIITLDIIISVIVFIVCFGALINVQFSF